MMHHGIKNGSPSLLAEMQSTNHEEEEEQHKAKCSDT